MLKNFGALLQNNLVSALTIIDYYLTDVLLLLVKLHMYVLIS